MRSRRRADGGALESRDRDRRGRRRSGRARGRDRGAPGRARRDRRRAARGCRSTRRAARASCRVRCRRSPGSASTRAGSRCAASTTATAAATRRTGSSPATGSACGAPLCTPRYAARAEELGARFVVDRVETVEQDSTGVRAAGIRADWLLAADGLHSTMARELGLALPAPKARRRYGQRRHYAVEPWSDLIEVHWTKAGEIYVTPTADGMVGLAAARAAGDALRRGDRRGAGARRAHHGRGAGERAPRRGTLPAADPGPRGRAGAAAR